MNKSEVAMSQLMHKYAKIHSFDDYIIRYKAVKELLDRFETILDIIIPEACKLAMRDDRKTVMEKDIISVLSRVYQL